MQPKPNEDTEAETRPAGKKGAKEATGPRLPPAPGGPLENGAPLFGSYVGSLDAVRYDGLKGEFSRSRLWQLAHHKKWQYVSFANAEIAVGMVVFQASYVANSFVYVFDRREKKMLAERETTAVPILQVKVGEHPSHGMSASFKRGKTTSVTMSREIGSFLYLAKVAWDGLEIDVQLNTRAAPPTLTAICPIERGLVNVTQKPGPLPTTGHVTVNGRRFVLDGATQAWGTLDYTSGLLAHETEWRWASGCGKLHEGPVVGLNLVTGFMEVSQGTGENAVWVDGDLIPVGAAKIDYDPDKPDAPWRVSTADGRVKLELRPEGVRRQTVDFKLVKSVYVAPVGTFHGEIRTPEGKVLVLDGVPGVSEDHHARW
jgi:hypothetical protein